MPCQERHPLKTTLFQTLGQFIKILKLKIYNEYLIDAINFH